MTDHAAIGRRFYQFELLARLAQAGSRVKFVRPVARADFDVPVGAHGTVVRPFLEDGALVAAVKLDDPPAGAESYEGEVHWIEHDNLAELELDVVLL